MLVLLSSANFLTSLRQLSELSLSVCMSVYSKNVAVIPTCFHALKREYSHSATYRLVRPELLVPYITRTVRILPHIVLKPIRNTVKRKL